jgi:2,3-bisphosphoglycerate-independent phosphoglycerate mutase
MAATPVLLVIMDGWGIGEMPEADAPRLAHTPAVDAILSDRPSATLAASGQDVGLPAGQMGNSEVGHITIGAGRIVWMDLPRIDRAIESGAFGETPALVRFAESLRRSGGTAHLFGLMSPGGVHSHQAHLVAAAKALAGAGVPVALHLVLDGRDTPPESALGYLGDLERDLAREVANGDVSVATVIGRFYAMDRDNRWERVGDAVHAMLHARGERAPDARGAIHAAQARGESDEFVRPTVIGGYPGMADGDGLFCINFRADRVREILSALLDPEFKAFDTGDRPRLAGALGMVSYSERLDALMELMFPAEPIPNTLGAWISAKGRRQIRIAETEKYPHVTFFLNGGTEEPAEGEERYMAPSPRVATYDLAPEMSAEEVTDRLVAAIGEGYDLIVVNYANPDMVGHTGNIAAAIRACEAVDRGVARALEALERHGGAMILTADHGNAEQMLDPATGGPHTAHTTNPVPVALVETGPDARGHGIRDGRLSDLAPTILDLMGIAPPPEMTGESLLVPLAAETGTK